MKGQRGQLAVGAVGGVSRMHSVADVINRTRILPGRLQPEQSTQPQPPHCLPCDPSEKKTCTFQQSSNAVLYAAVPSLTISARDNFLWHSSAMLSARDGILIVTHTPPVFALIRFPSHTGLHCACDFPEKMRTEGYKSLFAQGLPRVAHLVALLCVVLRRLSERKSRIEITINTDTPLCCNGELCTSPPVCGSINIKNMHAGCLPSL